MKRKMLTLLTGAFAACAAWAVDITEAQARTVAENFVSRDSVGKSVLPERTVETVVKRGGLYLVTLKPTGHILVSVNRSARPIPVFSGSDFVEPAVGSPQAAFLAVAETNAIKATGTQYETQWKTLLGQKVLKLTTSSTTAYVNIEPMLKTSWTQNYPYNELMPVINRSHALVGCVATAYSQILRYWEWPEVLNEDIVNEHSVDSMWGHKWRLKAGTQFGWTNIPYVDSYDNATLLRLGRATMFAGMLADMSYNTGASGTQTSRPGQNRWYTPYTCLDTSNSTLAQREAGMKQSLKNGCPFMVSVNYGTIGHAVVGDGWQESASGNYVHLNYGWGYNNSYYGTSDPLGVYLDAKPRPMVMNRPLPTSSALPINVEWSFPTKGYEKTLERFDVTYTEVSGTVGEWSDNMASQTGEFEGSFILIDEIGDRGDGNVLRIRPDADRAYYTWPTVVATEDTVFSYRVRSQDARNIFVEVQLFDQATGWSTVSTPKVSDGGVLDWVTESVSLKDYAGKGVAVRVMVTSTGSHYSDVNDKAVGVQLDDVTFTNVRQALASPAGTVQAGAGARSASVNTAALGEGTTYLFQVKPVFNDGTAGVANYPAACTISASGNAKPTITSVSSVRTGAPAVKDGMCRECYFGLNQFGVYGSEATTKLEAYLSNLVVIGEVEEEDTTQPAGTMITTHNKVSIADAVSVERKSPGNFLVKVNVSQLTDYLYGTGMILTLVARNDRGDVAQKDVFLKFTKTGSEQELAIADLPENGGTVTPDEPEPVYYTVTFNANGGTGGTSRQVLSGDTISTFPSVSWSGHTLEGWFTAGGTRVYESQVISGAVTYYAHWLTDTTPVDPGEDPVDPPSGGDEPVVEPTNGNPNDFEEGGTRYRFCNSVDKTSGWYDMKTQSTYGHKLPPIPFDLVLWWVDRYKAANGGSAPSGYIALTQDDVPYTTDKNIAQYTASLLAWCTDKATYFPSAEISAADWYGDATGDSRAAKAGRHIYAALAKGPVGVTLDIGYCVIWGCEYALDNNGDEYATYVWATDTKSRDSSISRYQLRSCLQYSDDVWGTPAPRLVGFSGGMNGLIQSYYPIVGPTVSDEPDPDIDPDQPVDPDEPITPVDPPVTPDEPVVPKDDPIGVADNSSNPGKNYTTSYGYEMYDNYWTARKRAIQEGRQLFILSGAAWCSNCAFVKNYLASLGTDFSNRFVVYYSDTDSTTCNCFKGGLPQYGAADPRAVDAFTGTLNGSVRSWDIAWQTDTSGIYQQDRGGYASDRVDLVVAKGKERARYNGLPANLVIRGLPTLGTGTTGRYELFAQFEDGTEMPVDYGVDWEVVSGNGTFSEAHVDGRDVGTLVITSGSVVIRARSKFYFTGTKTMTVDCAPESDIESVEIVTSEVNLEDDAAPTIEAQATLKNGKKIQVFGFGTWTAAFKERLPRTECPELEEDADGVTTPTITIDSASRLNYALIDGLLKVCDQKIVVTLTVNGKTTAKTITVWGPTKVIPSKWAMVSGPKQTTCGVVRLSCTELKYNYGGKIKTTKDAYFATYETVLKSGDIYTQTSRLRGLTVYVDNWNADRDYKVGLRTMKVNGKYKGYMPLDAVNTALATNVTCIASGNAKTSIAKGAVPEGFFKAFFPGRTDYDTLADEDGDGDGFKNWEEYVLGTDPTDKADAFTLMQGYQHLAAPAANGATMQYKVMYQQRARRIYYIEAKQAWGDEWTPVATVSLANMTEADVTTFTALNASHADAAKFFRVRASLYENVFSDPDNAPKITPNMLVAAPGAIIDLSAKTPCLNLSSFDTDATDAGTVWVRVAAGAKAGDVLMTAPKAAEKSLKACKPYESGDVCFEVVEENGWLALKVAGVPALEDGQGEVVVEGDKVVVTPNDGVSEITLSNVGDRQVEIPSSVEKVGGVNDCKKLTVKSAGHDVTQAMKFTPADGGFVIALNEAAVVTVGGEQIPVSPALADGDGETPFEVKDGQIVFMVKTIPGLKYEVLVSDSLGPDGFGSAGPSAGASASRCELKVDRPTGKTQGFYKIRVSR